jgi:hypothetical protein
VIALQDEHLEKSLLVKSSLRGVQNFGRPPTNTVNHAPNIPLESGGLLLNEDLHSDTIIFSLNKDPGSLATSYIYSYRINDNKI